MKNIAKKVLIIKEVVYLKEELIKKEAHIISKDLVKIRRFFHSNPELGFEEEKTSQYIVNLLKSMGIEVREGVAKTGIVGTLYGEKPGKTIALRADMDALPIKELNEIDYKSKIDGKMHGCGHDAHMTFVLGTAMVLSKFKKYIRGNIKFIFQPAEETTGGAKPMINEGALLNPSVDAIVGGHVWPGLNSGEIGIKEGPIMASSDSIEIKIIGKGGHAGKPNKTIDPIIIGSEIVTSLQKIVSRQIDPLESVVISICTFQSGEVFNAIPGEAILKGAVRTLNNEIREQLPSKIEKIIKGITESYGASYEYNYIRKYPVTDNDPLITKKVKKSAIEILGEDKVINIKNPSMGAEDFSYYLMEIPGTFIWIGTYNKEKNIVYDLHHPKFNIDEDIIEKAVSLYTKVILDFLENNEGEKV